MHGSYLDHVHKSLTWSSGSASLTPFPIHQLFLPGSGISLMFSGSPYHRDNVCTLHSPLPLQTSHCSSSVKHFHNPVMRSDVPIKYFCRARQPSAVHLSQPFIVNGTLIFCFPSHIKVPWGPIFSTWHSDLHIVGKQEIFIG